MPSVLQTDANFDAPVADTGADVDFFWQRRELADRVYRQVLASPTGFSSTCSASGASTLAHRVRFELASVRSAPNCDAGDLVAKLMQNVGKRSTFACKQPATGRR